MGYNDHTVFCSFSQSCFSGSYRSEEGRCAVLFTVADALKLKPFATGKVIAGRGGLDRIIEHVSVLEVDITVWCSSTLVRGASLEISSMYAIMECPDRQVEAIRRLDRSGGAGLVLCYVGTVLKEVSQELIDICNSLNFPLIVISGLVGYKELIRAVSDALLGLDNQKLQDAIDIYEYVTKLLMDGKGNTALVAALEHMLGKKALYFDQEARPVYTSGCAGEIIQELERHIQNNSTDFLLRHFNQTIFCQSLGESVCFFPVYNKTHYFGILSIVGDAFSELDKVAIAQIRNALSISTLSQISINQQQEKLRTDFIRDLLTGHTSDEEDILRRSAAIQCNITQVEGCIVLDICDFKELLKQRGEDEIFSLKAEFYKWVKNEICALAQDSICCGMSDKVVVLYIRSQNNRQTIVQTARSIQRSLKHSKNIEVAAGIGCRYRSFLDIQESYQTARLALRIAASNLSPSACADSEDYPAYMALLRTYQARPELILQTVDHLLAPVRDYDRAKNSALEDTFRVLLEYDLDYTQVGKRLFLHKNTVLQRKQKIASLYPEDPFQIPQRRQYEFAFILESLYRRKSGNHL